MRNNKERPMLFLRILKILNVLLISLPFVLSWFFYYGRHIVIPFSWKENCLIIVLYLVLYLIIVRSFDALSVSINKITIMVCNQMISALISDGLIYCILCLLSGKMVSILPGLMVIAVQLLVSLIWSYFGKKWYFAVSPPRKTLIVEETSLCLNELIEKYGLMKKYEVTKTLDVESCISDLSVLNEYEAVFLGGVHSHERNIILKRCIDLGIRVFVIPRIGGHHYAVSKPGSSFSSAYA